MTFHHEFFHSTRLIVIFVAAIPHGVFVRRRRSVELQQYNAFCAKCCFGLQMMEAQAKKPPSPLGTPRGVQKNVFDVRLRVFEVRDSIGRRASLCFLRYYGGCTLGLRTSVSVQVSCTGYLATTLHACQVTPLALWKSLLAVSLSI